MNYRIQAMIRRLGVPVSVGSVSTLGLFDETCDAEVLTGNDYAEMQVGTPSVLIETGKVPGLGVRDAITVDGRSYIVRSLTKELDGKVTRAFLMESA